MKKLFMLFFLALVTVLAPCMLSAAESVAEAAPGADVVRVLLGYLPEAWGGWVTLVITLCAAVSAIWPRPADSAHPLIRFAYLVVNAVGFNSGRARNADDAAARALKL